MHCIHPWLMWLSTWWKSARAGSSWGGTRSKHLPGIKYLLHSLCSLLCYWLPLWLSRTFPRHTASASTPCQPRPRTRSPPHSLCNLHPRFWLWMSLTPALLDISWAGIGAWTRRVSMFRQRSQCTLRCLRRHPKF